MGRWGLSSIFTTDYREGEQGAEAFFRSLLRHDCRLTQFFCNSGRLVLLFNQRDLTGFTVRDEIVVTQGGAGRVPLLSNNNGQRSLANRTGPDDLRA